MRVWVVFVGLGLAWSFGAAPALADDAPAASVAVSTMQLVPGSLPAVVTAYGSVAAAAGGERTVSLAGGGVVDSIAVLPGEVVTAGESLAVIGADPQSRADLQRAGNAVTAAKAARAHVAALLDSHLATTADLAVADQTLNDAAGALAALRAMGTGTGRMIVSPVGGVVSAVLTAPGALIAPGTALFKVIDTGSVAAIVGVAPGAAVRVGDAATVTLLGGGAVVSGRVTSAGAMLDAQTGLLDVTIPLGGPVTLGAPVRAAITTGTLTGFVVPRDAVQNDEQGDYVFQVDGRSIAHRVAVHVLGSEGGQSVLAPGLDVTMKLVTVGAYQLDDGTAVRPGHAH
jgi:RND family efflux transporter MFP subunit